MKNGTPDLDVPIFFLNFAIPKTRSDRAPGVAGHNAFCPFVWWRYRKRPHGTSRPRTPKRRGFFFLHNT